MSSHIKNPNLSEADARRLSSSSADAHGGRFDWQLAAMVAGFFAVVISGFVWALNSWIMSSEEAATARAGLLSSDEAITIECAPASGEARRCVVAYREFDLSASVSVAAEPFPNAMFKLRHTPEIYNGFITKAAEDRLKSSLDFDSVSKSHAQHWVRSLAGSAVDAAEVQLKEQLSAARIKKQIANSYRN